MILNFELYYFIKSSTCMSIFEERLKLIKKNQTKPTIIGLVWSEKLLNQLEVGLV